jgi:hypothetical protein
VSGESRASRAAIAVLAHAKEEFGAGADNGMIYVAIVLDSKTGKIGVESHGPKDLLVNLVSQVAERFEGGGPGSSVGLDGN